MNGGAYGISLLSLVQRNIEKLHLRRLGSLLIAALIVEDRLLFAKFMESVRFDVSRSQLYCKLQNW